MKINVLFLSFLLCLSAPLAAQPVAKIVGPTQSPPGELTALSSTGSSGDNLLWIKPEGLTVMQAGCEMMDQQLFFATTKEGVYEFILIVADKSASISYAKHSVTVGKPLVVPPPGDGPPPPPVDPGPTPGKWGGLVGVSKAGADKVNDPVTRKSLKDGIDSRIAFLKSMCDAGKCPGLSQAQSEVTAAIDSVLLMRQNRFSAWDEWRRGNNAHLKEKTVTNMPDYLEAIKAISAGL
jgi:hypothetical protein